MSYVSQDERDFTQAERLAGALAAAFVLLWVFLNWSTYFPTDQTGNGAVTEKLAHPQPTATADAGQPAPKKPRAKSPRHEASGEGPGAGPANDAAPMADLAPSDCNEYIRKYAPLAVEEMRRTGVPASISLAQGLVESRAGRSGLALTANNHFGIKCHVRGKCKAGHCINFTDDNEVDYFIVYQNAYRSWKAHSDFLRKPRYQNCFQYGNDYRKWAFGLKAAGYATAPTYARKLIGIIERYELYLYDQK